MALPVSHTNYSYRAAAGAVQGLGFGQTVRPRRTSAAARRNGPSAKARAHGIPAVSGKSRL